jgi:hypothetical protein
MRHAIRLRANQRRVDVMPSIITHPIVNSPRARSIVADRASGGRHPKPRCSPLALPSVLSLHFLAFRRRERASKRAERRRTPLRAFANRSAHAGRRRGS